MSTFQKLNDRYLLEQAILASIKAGKKLLQLYYEPHEIEIKKDLTPVTSADIASQKILISQLSSTKIPIISEENEQIPFSQRSSNEYFWLIDPLDGTKEFIKKNGDFTINIALIQNNKPIIGVVVAPALNRMYFSSPSLGAFKANIDFTNNHIYNLTALNNNHLLTSDHLIVITSRSHMNSNTEEFIKLLNNNFVNITIQQSGSSLKMCMIAEGEAHLYPRFGRTMEWDTAAAHAILLQTSCNLLNFNDLSEMEYNKPNLENPPFIALNPFALKSFIKASQ